MQFGYSEREVGFLRYGKWADLFESYKKVHNITVEKKIYSEPEKVVSIFDI